jgi:hypothetical protein
MTRFHRRINPEPGRDATPGDYDGDGKPTSLSSVRPAEPGHIGIAQLDGHPTSFGPAVMCPRPVITTAMAGRTSPCISSGTVNRSTRDSRRSSWPRRRSPSPPTNGDHITIAVYRPSTGEWVINNLPTVLRRCGQRSSTSDYDGHGKADIAAGHPPANGHPLVATPTFAAQFSLASTATFRFPATTATADTHLSSTTGTRAYPRGTSGDLRHLMGPARRHPSRAIRWRRQDRGAIIGRQRDVVRQAVDGATRRL